MATTKLKVRTPVFRGSYAKIATPQTTKDGRTCYEITGVFDIEGEDWRKDPKFAELLKAFKSVAMEKHGKITGVRRPFRIGIEDDTLGAEPYDEETLEKNPFYRDKLIIPFRSYNMQPDCAKLIGGKPQRVEDLTEMYSGAYFIATVTPFAYGGKKNKDGEPIKRGVSFGLASLLFVRDGEPLGAVSDAMKDFEDFDASDPKYGIDNSDLLGDDDDDYDI